MEVSRRRLYFATFIFLVIFSTFNSYRAGLDYNRSTRTNWEPQDVVDEEPYWLPRFDENGNGYDNDTIKEKHKNKSSSTAISSKVNNAKTLTRPIQEEDIKRREKRPKPVDYAINEKETVEDNDHGANDSFSACILWMDDNHRLDEWMAYHYYFLQLRYVVMNIDPFSRTSPKAIVDRWNDDENNYDLNMTIVTMTDSDYIDSFDHEMEKIEIARNSSTDQNYKFGMAKTSYHRYRQHEFYKACSRHLIKQNRSWTSYHDTDEFFTIEHQIKVSGKIENITASSCRKMKQPGYVLHILNSIKRKQPRDSYVNNTGLSCVHFERRRFCANELSEEEINNLFPSLRDSIMSGTVPEGFMNSSIDRDTFEDRKTIIRRFDTLRYKYITHGNDGMPKSIIDLSQRNTKLYAQDKWYKHQKGPHKWNTHRPMQHLCSLEKKHRLSEIQNMINKENFVINHYLGSFESYSFRNDARQGGLRTYSIYEERANQTKGEFSHVIRPWLRGFTELVGGADVASYLLQDAGQFPEDYDIVSRIRSYNETYNYGRNNRKGKRGG